MRDITLNPEQRLYVIATEGGVTCFGFDNARDHAWQIAQRLDRPDLMPTADRKSTRLNSSHIPLSRMPSSA